MQSSVGQAITLRLSDKKLARQIWDFYIFFYIFRKSRVRDSGQQCDKKTKVMYIFNYQFKEIVLWLISIEQ